MLPFRPANPIDNEPTPVDGQVGYKRPPVKNRFRKGQSGNPRGRWRGQRNLPAVLAEILDQIVPVKQGNKSQLMSKGETLIKMLMSMAHQGHRGAINAMLNITEKIGRIENAELESGARKGGIMLVPGVAASKEEWQREIAARPQTPAYVRAPTVSPPRRIVLVKRRPRIVPSPPKPESVSEVVASSPPIETVPADVPTYDNREATCRAIDRALRNATFLQTPPDGTAAVPVPSTPRTGTYRQVNRNKSDDKKTDS
jgi:Family of unknown function (DUF5681)